MVYSKVKSNGVKASPCFEPFLIEKTSQKRLLTRTLLYVLAMKVGLNVVEGGGLDELLGNWVVNARGLSAGDCERPK